MSSVRAEECSTRRLAPGVPSPAECIAAGTHGEDVTVLGDARYCRMCGHLMRFTQTELDDAHAAWDARVAHLAVCTVKPWWDSPPGCQCTTKDRSE